MTGFADLYKRASVASRIALLLLATGGAAHAKTICVDADSSKCEATVQDAVDAAAPGDTIDIKSGVYFETVEIPATKPGLKLEGKSSAVIDDGGFGGFGIIVETPPGPLTILANDVQIEGISLRGGDSHHIRLGDGVTGTRVEKVTSTSSSRGFVYSLGSNNHDTRIEKCEVRSMRGGVFLRGNDVRVRKTKFRNIGTAGFATAAAAAIRIVGASAVVERNELENIVAETGIVVSGPFPEIVRNELRRIGQQGMYIEGEDLVVTRNIVEGSESTGIDTFGTGDMIVSKNRVENGQGLNVACDDDCAGVRVEKNRIKGNGAMAQALSFHAFAGTASALRVAKNEIVDASSTGIRFHAGPGAQLSKNRVRRAGDRTKFCFEIEGSGVVASDNEAEDCASDGFWVTGDDHTIIDNEVEGAGRTGIRIASGSTSVQVEDNRVRDAVTAYRIDDGWFGGPAASDTHLQDNRVSGQRRLDLCNEGTDTTLDGNDFDTALVRNWPQDNTPECPGY